MATGKHSKPSRWRRPPATSRRRMIEMVDAATLTTHLLTTDAAAAGRAPQGRYVALCGTDILPAALVDPGRGSCRSCRGASA